MLNCDTYIFSHATLCILSDIFLSWKEIEQIQLLLSDDKKVLMVVKTDHFVSNLKHPLIHTIL